MIEWLINTIRHFQELGIQEDLLMTRIFEPETIQTITEELQFTLLCIGNLTQNFNYHAQQNGAENTMAVLQSFKQDKLKLEIKLATLSQFLEQ